MNKHPLFISALPIAVVIGTFTLPLLLSAFLHNDMRMFGLKYVVQGL